MTWRPIKPGGIPPVTVNGFFFVFVSAMFRSPAAPGDWLRDMERREKERARKASWREKIKGDPERAEKERIQRRVRDSEKRHLERMTQSVVYILQGLMQCDDEKRQQREKSFIRIVADLQQERDQLLSERAALLRALDDDLNGRFKLEKELKKMRLAMDDVYAAEKKLKEMLEASERRANNLAAMVESEALRRLHLNTDSIWHTGRRRGFPLCPDTPASPNSRANG